MTFEAIHNKIQTWDELSQTAKGWKSEGLRIVFTNGCFDILHFGHIHYLAQARDLGERLVVGMNSAGSVRRLKGSGRPINDEATRLHLLAALSMVDAVTAFEEDTPYELIRLLLPDILVKGGDWDPEAIVGSDLVLANGGVVRSLPYVEGYSTTLIEKKIKG